MGQDRKRMNFAWILAGLFFFSAGLSEAQEQKAAYNRLLEQAQKDRENGKYKESAVGAARAFSLADHLENSAEARRKAAELSADSNASARKSGIEIKGTVRVVIDCDGGKLYLLEGDAVRQIYDVMAGSEFMPAPGEYIAGPKLAYPNYELNGERYSILKKENPIGARWIEIRTPDGKGVSGIHGRKNGTKEHLLFFSLKNADVIELFGLLAEGGRIDIK